MMLIYCPILIFNNLFQVTIRMAFFRNYTNAAVSDIDLNDKRPGGNDDLETTSTMDKEFTTKSLNESDNNLLNLGDTNTNATRKPSGKWGSTFWKDCQPMNHRQGSDSGHESKSSSGYNIEDGSGNDLSEVNKGQNVDEMLSDDYYELDGDDQNDSMHPKFVNNAVGYSSLPQPRVSASNFLSRNKSKSSFRGDYVEDAEFEDDDDEEEEEDGNLMLFDNILFCCNYYMHHFLPIFHLFAAEDDPADADFDPDLITTSDGRGKKVIFCIFFFHACFNFIIMVYWYGRL